MQKTSWVEEEGVEGWGRAIELSPGAQALGPRSGRGWLPPPLPDLTAHNRVPESRARSEKREIADLRSSKSG